jgi:UDPglucose 6-dehydrogenase/GDP-mannose 6-dehydrogenase
LHTTLRNAELTKYASNSLLSLLISFSNELAAICEAVPGTDIDVVMDGLHLDKRLSPVVNGSLVKPQILSYLRAGCGFGGSCLPKDVNALRSFAHEQGVQTPLLDATIAVNEARAAKVIAILEKAIGDLPKKEIALLGLAFKPHTDDVRESPALKIIAALLGKGCLVRTYDPMVSAKSLDLNKDLVVDCDSAESAMAGADAVVIATAWPEFAALDWERLTKKMRQSTVVDGRRLLARIALPPNVVYCPIGLHQTDSALAKLGSEL